MIKPQPKDLTGIMVALITPFTNDGLSVDASRLQQHIEFMITSGVHGLVPCGSTGEFTSLTSAERKKVIELCVEYSAGRVPIVAGVGALTTAETIDYAVHAAQSGVDAIMVVPPFYDPPTLSQLHEFFKDISSATEGIPIMYYNIPSVSGTKLSPEQLAYLGKECGVRYLKDTSGDAPSLTDLLFTYADDITAFNGWDTLTFYGLAAGAKGSVWGATNIIPELSVELWNAVAVEGDLKKGREIWSRIFPIVKFLESGGSVGYGAAVKTGCELRGIRTGGMRKPFGLLEEGDREVLRGLLEGAGIKTA